MPRQLGQDERDELLRTFDREAFRLELQPAYSIPYEQDWLAKWRAGHPDPPDTDPTARAWFDMVRKMTAEGKRWLRVRVHDDPPTEYQQWMHWFDAWNTEAGETIRYMTRAHAYDVGLLREAGPADWWLVDSATLVLMHFDAEGRRVGMELTEETDAVGRACALRDLAIRHSTIGPWTRSQPTG